MSAFCGGAGIIVQRDYERLEFTIEDVLPGNYQMRVQMYDSEADPQNPAKGKLIGLGDQDVVVPEAAGDASAQSLEIGSVMVKLNSR